MVTLTRLMNQARLETALPAHPGPMAPRDIPAALRRWVLERDGHHCCAPGCRNRHGLEVCQVHPGRNGGPLNPGNLVTVCNTCRPMWKLMGSGEFHVVHASRPSAELQATAAC